MSADELDAIAIVNPTLRCSPSDHAILDITLFFHTRVIERMMKHFSFVVTIYLMHDDRTIEGK